MLVSRHLPWVETVHPGKAMKAKLVGVLRACLAGVPLVALAAGSPVRKIEVLSEPSCPECRIEGEKVVTMTPDDSSQLGWIAVRGRADQYLASSRNGTQPAIQLFDSVGRYRATIGRQGRGPGEYEDTQPFLIRGDTIYVYDLILSRVTVLSPTGRYIRTIPLPGPVQELLIHPDGTMAMSSEVALDGGFGLILRQLDRNGRPQRTSKLAKYERGVCHGAEAFGLAPHRGLWVGPHCRYAMDLRDSTGEVRMQVVRKAEWFEEYYESPSPYIAPPRPLLSSISQDSRGLLWVMVTVADAEWDKHWKNRDYS
jgi:hypothetical protein